MRLYFDCRSFMVSVAIWSRFMDWDAHHRFYAAVGWRRRKLVAEWSLTGVEQAIGSKHRWRFYRA